MKLIDLCGAQFTRLTVTHRAANGCDGSARWVCVCTCGTFCVFDGGSLRRNHVVSCGCWRRERIAKANAANGKALEHVSREYSSYHNARQRCDNPKATGYFRYGGRGIRFEFTSFQQFFAELGHRPKGKTVDRIDNDGHYTPGNVRWATYKEQRANQRRKA